jgi:phosphoribosylglycinamide formyltransferase 1
MSDPRAALPIVILISGSGTNLQAIIDAARKGELPVDIRAVISNRPAAAGLDRARAAGIHAEALDHREFDGREGFDRALAERIDAHAPALVVLAGFMRILTAGFVRHYQGRLLNIHPSLLPEFRGLNTHARAIEAGAECHGASVHFVTDELDGGPVVLQVQVPVHTGDTVEALAARVLEQEHRLYPLAIRWFAEGRLQLKNGTAILDGNPLNAPCLLDADTGALKRCP